MTTLPGRRPGPAERDELLRLYDAMGHDGRKMVLFVARAVAQGQGVRPVGAPLLDVGIASSAMPKPL